MEAFKLEMEQELQTLRFELEDEGKAMLGILLPCYYLKRNPITSRTDRSHYEQSSIFTKEYIPPMHTYLGIPQLDLFLY